MKCEYNRLNKVEILCKRFFNCYKKLKVWAC